MAKYISHNYKSYCESCKLTFQSTEFHYYPILQDDMESSKSVQIFNTELILKCTIRHTQGNNTLQETTFLIWRLFKTWNAYSRGPTRSSELFNLLVDVIQWRLSLKRFWTEIMVDSDEWIFLIIALLCRISELLAVTVHLSV
ncbi:hypothetical protein CDAR_501701 [Caerostris darwini]|uniref:Uncharacterized protein n=1 Tax=Caerostris darwini TaxID=1538125 RepID=A0AAV4TR78_9ARAC|nr:hypothetical protein CDAR_501701 [Caerostris darwini]